MRTSWACTFRNTGGTGIGVIGALAGAGLKLTGNDGRFKGKFRLRADAQGVAEVGQIKHRDVDLVSTLDGVILGDQERVVVGGECKLVLRDGVAVLMVRPSDGEDIVAAAAIALTCNAFTRDDDDECYVDGDAPSCFNCRARRWVRGGFTCTRGLLPG